MSPPRTIRNVRDGKPWPSTSTFTRLLSSVQVNQKSGLKKRPEPWYGLTRKVSLSLPKNKSRKKRSCSVFLITFSLKRGVRGQELFESRGGRPGLPVPNSPYALCGRKATLNLNLKERWFKSLESAPETSEDPARNTSLRWVRVDLPDSLLFSASWEELVVD